MATAKKKKPAVAKKTKKGVVRPSTRAKTPSLRANGSAAKAKAKAKPAVKAKPAAKAKSRSKAAAKAKPAKLPRQVLVDRDRTRLLHDGEHFGVATIALHEVATLELPSGTIVTCDPFLVDGPALARAVAPGTYPVSLAVATFTGDRSKGDQRIAAATVRFRAGTPARWEVATFDATPRTRRGDPGYPVDAGTGCFMDARTQSELKAQPAHWPTPSDNELEKQLMTEHYQHTWSWAAFRPLDDAPGNCVAFMTGFGDGTYSSYWGLDEAGTPVCLITDFDVFTDEDWTVT